jgi:Tol biopolymer transport system component/mono/diheme cytochrome c family protein
MLSLYILHFAFAEIEMRSWHVFALVALLVAAAAGAWLLFRNAGAPAAGFSQTAQAGNLSVTVQVDDTTVGTRVFDVAVDDADGKPADISGVKLRFSMLDMDMGASEVVAQPLGAGRFQAKGPYFTMVGNWQVEATLLRDGQAPLQVPFTLAVAARGEASGPANPLKADAQSIQAGQQLYAANCVVCHGPAGKGDGTAAAGLSPRPADFTQHMTPGKHTDGQVFLWIRDGFPGTAMPAWKDKLSEQQIWQLVTYLRTFGQAAPQAQATGLPQQATAQAQQLPAGVPTAQEPLPPMIFARRGNIWRSDGSGAAPRQLTSFGDGSYTQYPTFSPDGARVAFVLISPPPPTATLPLPSSTLYVMNADGSDQRPIWKPAQGMLSLLTWMPDGQSLYIATNGLDAGQSSNRQIQVVRYDIATGAHRPVLDDALDPTLSRDGTQLAFLKLSEDGYTMSLMLAAPDGSGAKELIKGDDFQGFYAPRFSPDGKRIVVAAIGGPETDEQGNPKAASAPAPLGRLLGLLEPPAAEAHGIPWDLWSVNTDGSGLRRLTHFSEDLPMAAFSPDGKRIAVLAESGVYMIDGDGSHLRRIDPVGDRGGLDWAR